LAPGGQEQGMNLYGRQDVPAGTLVTVNVSGTAAPLDANAGAGQGQQGQGRDAQQGGGESAGVIIQQVPGRLNDIAPTWLIAGVFIIGFGILGLVLWNKKVESTPAEGQERVTDAGALRPKKAKPSVAPATDAPAAIPTASSPMEPVTPTNGASSMAEVDAAIGTSLDALKERLFRLELRHQAGTISEAEYAQERARAEKVLRDLVRG
jgi:hypothetical protein